MRALPASLDAVQPRVREIYAGGWRPPVPDGPTRDELAELVSAHALGRSALTPSAPSQAAGSTLPRWSHSVRPSRNRTPSAHRASTAPPANCSV